MSASIRNSVELQSLRGIAALCVVLHHSLRTLESTELTAFISEAMLNAHAAVVVFFVLSGFVLTKSLVHRGFSLSAVSDFYLRRMFRIYPAMWVGIIFGTIYLLFIRALPSPHFSLWAAGHYDPTGATTSSIIQTLLGLYNYLLPPLWTITVEIVASALLPLLVWLMSRRIGLAVSTIFALAVLSLVSGVAARQVPLYLVDFSFGIFLATNPRLTRFNPGPWGMVIAVTVLMWFRTIHPWLYHDALPSLVEGLASMVVIAGLVAGNAKWMRMRPLVLLGDSLRRAECAPIRRR